MKQSIAITGIREFLGANLLIRLQNIPDIKLTLIERFKPSFVNDNVAFYRIDLTDPRADIKIYEALERENVDTFIHLAFFESHVPFNYSYAHEVQVIGTWHILNACAKKKIRKLILSSTTEIYGADPMNPNLIKEDAPLRIRPDYKYIKDRVEAEDLVKKFAKKNPNTKVFILRKCPALGDKVKNFMTWYLSGAIICSVLGFDPMMQFIHQEDLIESHFKVALLDEAPGGIYNIAGRGALPLSYITRLMGKINIPLIYSFAYLLFYILRAGRIAPFPPQHIDYIRFTFVADGTKAKENLGFIPKYSTKEVVEEFAGYVKLKKARIKQD